MPDKGSFFECVEEAQPHVMVRAIRGKHERHLGMRKLACDALQRGIVLSIGIENHGRRIAGKARGGECIDLKNAQLTPLQSQMAEFCTHWRVRLHLSTPWGGL